MKQLLTDFQHSFDDVLIVPSFSDVASRKDVYPGTKFLWNKLSIPVISSNMDTVTGSDMVEAMSDYGALGCLHRFCSIDENVRMFKARNKPPYAMVSVGIGAKELERTEALRDAGANIFVLDVAHGASMVAVEQAQKIYDMIAGCGAELVVGNFATGRSINDFRHASGDVAKADKEGIGGGSMCQTRVVTGCGLPTLSSILSCAHQDVQIIADGGIRTSGDIAKALAAGASMVMLGNMLAGTDETPGEVEVHVVRKDGYKRVLTEQEWREIRSYRCIPEYKVLGMYKKYRGSASQESYEAQRKVSDWRTAEGVSTLVPHKGPVSGVLQQIEAGLRSAMSYVGASTLSEFKSK